MPRAREMLVKLEDTPHIVLQVLFILRIDGIELSQCARRVEERRMEETCEPFESARKSIGCNVEIVVGRIGRCIRIRRTIILCEILEGGCQQICLVPYLLAYL